MMNFEPVSVAQLRAGLVGNNCMTEEESLNIKGKSNLVYEVKKAISSGTLTDFTFFGNTPTPVEEPEPSLEIELEDEDTNEVIDSLSEAVKEVIEEAVSPEPKTPKPRNNKFPKIFSQEWQDFVLSQFSETEILDIGENKYPTVAGLRRVVELLLGEIVFSGPTQVFPSTDVDGVGRASVVYRVDIAWRLDEISLDLENGIPLRSFAATAEAWHGNIKDDRFKPFPLTIAETRAEGRALRKALFLKTQSAEELLGSEMPTKQTVEVVEEYNENSTISSQQISLVRTKCLQLKIDVEKFAPDIENLKKKDGVELIKKIHSYQGGENIPEALLLKE